MLWSVRATLSMYSMSLWTKRRSSKADRNSRRRRSDIHRLSRVSLAQLSCRRRTSAKAEIASTSKSGWATTPAWSAYPLPARYSSLEKPRALSKRTRIRSGRKAT